MSGPWYVGSATPQAWNGGTSPDPVTTANPDWTWDVEFGPVGGSLYAKTTLHDVSDIGGGTFWVAGGIVDYRTKHSRIGCGSSSKAGDVS